MSVGWSAVDNGQTWLDYQARLHFWFGLEPVWSSSVVVTVGGGGGGGGNI